MACVSLPNQGQSCDRNGARTGRPPTTRMGISSIDAYLWIEYVRESDSKDSDCHANDSAAA